MKIQWTRSAIADLTSIYEHIESDSPRYALAVVDRLTKRTARFTAFPKSGQMVPEYQRDEIREVIEYSYRILYHLGDNTISIIAVIHGANPLPDSPPSNRG